MEFANEGGQTFIVTIKPGQTRGGHYHTRKSEHFTVVSGDAILWVKDRMRECPHPYVLHGDYWHIVVVPPLHAHSIQNNGKTDAIVVVWSSEVFSADDPDTYPTEI